MKIDSTPGEDLALPPPGLSPLCPNGYTAEQMIEAILAERERCAKLCEDEVVDADATGDHTDYAYNIACEHCAAAIRASR